MSILVAPYFNIFQQYLEHPDVFNYLTKDEISSLSRHFSLPISLASLKSIAKGGARLELQTKFYKKMCSSIRSYSFVFDKVFGKTCVHKIQTINRIHSDFGDYTLKNGEVFRMNMNDEQFSKYNDTFLERHNKDEIIDTTQTIPTPYKQSIIERHIYRRHPHAYLECVIEIKTDKDDEINVNDYYFQTRNTPTIEQIHSEFDKFVNAFNFN